MRKKSIGWGRREVRLPAHCWERERIEYDSLLADHAVSKNLRRRLKIWPGFFKEVDKTTGGIGLFNILLRSWAELVEAGWNGEELGLLTLALQRRGFDVGMSQSDVKAACSRPAFVQENLPLARVYLQ